jgi:capsular polysaccharide transport system permease protein
VASLSEGWRIQRRVIVALMSRELTTRFGRENIGFLWIMAEPLLFACLVALVWTIMKGPEEHGVGIVAFVVSGYLHQHLRGQWQSDVPSPDPHS